MRKLIGVKLILLLFSVFVLCSMATIKPIMHGDGYEYTYMVQAFENHFSPEVNDNDIASSQAILKANAITVYPDGYSGFYKSYSGKMYSYHFWFYSLLVLPVKIILKLLNLNQFKCFQLTNGILFLTALWVVYFYAKKKKNILVALLALNPVLFYLIWTHPEVFSYSFVAMAIAMFLSKKYKFAILFSSIASLQNAPLLVLTGVFLLFYLLENRNNYKDWILAVLCGSPTVLPYAFYLFNYGTPNLIIKVGAAGLQHMSLQRMYDMVFDMNIGMIIYVPIIVILFFVVIIRDILNKKYLNLIWPISIFVMIILSTQTANWNSGCAGISRYGVWVLPIMIYYVADLKKHIPIICALVCNALIVVTMGGFLYSGANYTELTPTSRFVMENFPYLYSPDYETFTERVRGVPGNFKNNLPIVFEGNGHITKVLTDRENFLKLQDIYDIKDTDYYEKVSTKLTKKIEYVNLPKGVIGDDTRIAPLNNFKDTLKLIDSPILVESNTTIKIKVSVTNTSIETWINKGIDGGKYKVALAYHWYDTKGNAITKDGYRTLLPHNIKPNKSFEASMNVLTPSVKGDYILEVDMVQEGVTWFKDKGCETLKIPIQVN